MLALTKLDGMNFLNRLARSYRSDLRSTGNGAKKDVVVECDQPKSTLSAVNGSVAVEIDGIPGSKFDHRAWLSILTMFGRRQRR